MRTSVSYPNGVNLYGTYISPTGGNVFYVAASGGSDGNDGLSPLRGLATLSQAITNATANNGDTIVLLPGAHSWTGSTAVNKAGLCITGLPGNYIRPRASVTVGGTTSIMAVSVANIEIAYLRVINITAQAAISWTAAATNLYVHDNSFDMATAAANTATNALGHLTTSYTVAPANVIIDHNYFEVTGAQGPAIKLGDATDFVVSNNTFAAKGGTWAVAVEQYGVLGWGTYRDNDFPVFKGATVTKGITGTDLTSTLSVAILRNFFGQTTTTPIDDWGTTDAYIAENYLASSGGAGGGVLWSSIT